jgi:hypothetical protein
LTKIGQHRQKNDHNIDRLIKKYTIAICTLAMPLGEQTRFTELLAGIFLYFRQGVSDLMSPS